jgi:hypothetical protein
VMRPRRDCALAAETSTISVRAAIEDRGLIQNVNLNMACVIRMNPACTRMSPKVA